VRGERALVNGLGIFAAATFVIFYFDLPLAWYGAAFLAWFVRARFIYQRDRTVAKSGFTAPAVSATDENVVGS
jgi:hypothetical protein